MSSGWGPPPRRRPPWWPESEPFPPTRRWGGRRGPPQFVRRIGCFAVAVLALTALMGAVAGSLLARFGIAPVAALAVLFLIMLVAIASGAMRRMTRPMDTLIDAAGRIESGDYSAQVPERGSPELRSVARAFNSMSSRLKANDEQRRTFLADVTHELRTPLSVIRGQVEAIADGMYPADSSHLAPILDATHVLDRLVEDLRTLVLTDAGSLVLNKEPTDLAALLAEIVDSFKPQADSADIALESDLERDLAPVEVDPARIRSVIGNLLSNAIRHTSRGGSINVELARSEDQAVATVTDSGEGIAPELLPHVFERFVKGAESNGSGLGLAIAHDIVAAHDGKLEIESEYGSGTRLRMSLPLESE
jgi:two-component system sensor histidine kinase BaeS